MDEMSWRDCHCPRAGLPNCRRSQGGDNVRRLTNSGPDGLSTNPLWEPDGRHLTYSVRSPDDWERRRINVVTLDEVVVGTEITDASTWSPDGSMLARFGSAAAPIELLDPVGELIRRLSIPADHVVSRPGVWSPDGRYLAVLTVIYCSECGQGGEAGALLIVPIDGSPVIVADEDVGFGYLISWQAVVAAP